MARGSRNYWVGLRLIINALCLYLRRWRTFLPNDLPPNVVALMDLAELACQAMEVYDAARKGGI